MEKHKVILVVNYYRNDEKSVPLLNGRAPFSLVNIKQAHATRQIENQRLIEEYNPSIRKSNRCTVDHWDAYGSEIKDLVRVTISKHPLTRAGGLLSALTALTIWADNETLGRSVIELLTREHIDTYTSTLEKAQGTRRHQLNLIRDANRADTSNSKVKFAKKPLATPYQWHEIEQYLNYALALTNQNRQNRLLAIIALAAGAGLVRGNQRNVCKKDIHEHSEEHIETDIKLYVKHKNVCRPVHPFLTSTLASLENETLHVSTLRCKNYLSQPVSWITPASGLERLSIDRLRAFYIKWLLETKTPLKHALKILDLKTISGIAGYLKHLEEPKATCDEH